MKMNKLLSTTALIVSLALFQSAYADPTPAAKAPPAPVSAAQGNAKGNMSAQLPPDKAKIFNDAIGQLRPKNKDLHDQVVKLQQDLSTIMTAAKFDKAAYIAKNAEIGKVFAQMANNRAETIASVAAQFSVDERKTLEQMTHQQQRRPAPAAK